MIYMHPGRPLRIAASTADRLAECRVETRSGAVSAVDTIAAINRLLAAHRPRKSPAHLDAALARWRREMRSSEGRGDYIGPIEYRQAGRIMKVR